MIYYCILSTIILAILILVYFKKEDFVGTNTDLTGITSNIWGPLYSPHQNDPQYSYKQMSRLPWCMSPQSHLPQCQEMKHIYPYVTDCDNINYEFNKLE